MQTSVNLYPQSGFAGQVVTTVTPVYTAENYISDGTVKAGGFAFTKAHGSSVKGVQFPLASATAEAGHIALGIAQRLLTGLLLPNVDGTETYAEGENVTIIRRGDVYAIATGTCTVGQAVLCNPTTGAVTYGAAGATNDTGWVVKKAGAEGDVVIYSNQALAIKD